jgi:predicted metalloendopeptidase
MPRIVTVAALAALALAGAAKAAFIPENFDPAVRPQDDFFRYANGSWLNRTAIPPEYARWGAFDALIVRNQEILRLLCERASAQENRATRVEQMVGDFYASGLDAADINAAGPSPLEFEFLRISAIKSPEDVLVEIACLHRIGVPAAFSFASAADFKESDREIAEFSQGGLGLPERDYYFRDDERSKRIREQYVAHVSRMLGLLGDTPANAQTGAEAVMRLETALAKASLPQVALRNPYASYHKMSLEKAETLVPGIEWRRYLDEIHAPAFSDLNFAHPEFFKAFSAVLAQTPVSEWQTYLRWQLVNSFAPYLSDNFAEEDFSFNGATLSGTKKMKQRWQRVVTTIDDSIGEALGQLYVATYFPPEAKARALKLVGDLRSALRDRIQTLDWMDEPTRAKALEKLDAFTVKIGYPDKWRDYSTLVIDRGPYVLNVLKARAFEVRRNLAKIGGPVDKTEWGMTPPTVNAYYNPTRNEIVFPAGILQPPFFDAKADDAVNYGAIGAVIGHEMTHGFDDQGRQFDGQGNLNEWWTPESEARFKTRSAAIVKQFNEYFPIEKVHINGELTQGENIADLGGLRIAFAALQKALAGQSHEKIGGFTPEQRFFLSFASIYAVKFTPEEALRRLRVDPHSPGKYRCNGPLSNMDEFANAFGVPEGAPMRRPAADRFTIW